MTIIIRPILSKYQFRKLFTQAERIAIDNFEYNDALTLEQKAALHTLTLDFNAATVVDLNLPDTQAAVAYLETIGLLGTGRADQVINLVPV